MYVLCLGLGTEIAMNGFAFFFLFCMQNIQCFYIDFKYTRENAF
jgi:hypothetical protein